MCKPKQEGVFMFHPFVFSAVIPEGAVIVRVVYQNFDELVIDAYGEDDLLIARAQYGYNAVAKEWEICPSYPWAPSINPPAQG